MMRFAGVVGLVLCAPLLAQELDINGYSYVVLLPSQGRYFDFNAALRETLRSSGLEVHRKVEEIPRGEWPKALYMKSGMGNPQATVFIEVYDVASQARIAVCIGPLAGTMSRRRGNERLRPTIETIFQHMGFRAFEPSAYDANLRIRAAATSAASTSPPSKPLRMSCRQPEHEP